MFRSSSPIIPSSKLVVLERGRSEERELTLAVWRGMFDLVSPDKNADRPKRKSHITQSYTAYYRINFTFLLILSVTVKMTYEKTTNKTDKMSNALFSQGIAESFCKIGNSYCSE